MMSNYDVIKGMSSNELAFVLYSLVLPFCGEMDEANKLDMMRKIKGFLSASAGGVSGESTDGHNARGVHPATDC